MNGTKHSNFKQRRGKMNIYVIAKETQTSVGIDSYCSHENVEAFSAKLVRSYQITYSIGGLGEVQLTVYTDVDENDPNFCNVIDKLCMDEIIDEVNCYGKIKSFDND